MDYLTQRSIEIILQNQAPSGAYMASPNFPTYHYCWFRDGSFIAYAMDLVGEHASAARFHDWATMVINQRANMVQRLVAHVEKNETLDGLDYLHTRFTMEGHDATHTEWPNFQLDGFGTWLWALGEHLVLVGKSPSDAMERAAGLLIDYLTALWQHPCYDCWEENPDKIHPHTLAAIYGGLKAHSQFTPNDHGETLHDLATYVRRCGVTEGYFVKYIGSNIVDANLIGLSTPYRLVEPDDPIMLKTVLQIEQSLVHLGGVHRFPDDKYYGGGEWVLLAGWLGWYYAEIGNYNRAKAMLDWIEKKADINGYLPEQDPVNLNDPDNYEPWVKRWGPIAKPLLWSHAMYLVLKHYISLREEGKEKSVRK